MKWSKIILGMLLCMISLDLVAFSGTTVTGVWNRKNDGSVILFKVVDGNLEEVSSYKITEDGKFGFYFEPAYEGIYMIGTGSALAMQDKYSFYFKGGERLNFSVNDSTYVLSGSNSAENIELARWHDLLLPLERKSLYFYKVRSNYSDFFPELERISKIESAYVGRKLRNAKFQRVFRLSRRLDLLRLSNTFLVTPRTVHPTVAEYSSFYKTMNLAAFSAENGLLELPFSGHVLNGLARVNLRMNDVVKPTIAQMLSLVSNDTLKGELVLKNLASVPSYSTYMDYLNDFGRYILSNGQKRRNTAMLAVLASLKKGDLGLDFSYPDRNGKMVTMSDLRGKVVLIDVWATWCGPCKVEIPYLKKLEDEMKGTDLQVVSISIDEARDKEKWLKAISENNIGGLHLFASGWGDLTKFYKISSIPRFMVFDREGKIVSVDAPRPSNPELKKLLEETLANKL